VTVSDCIDLQLDYFFNRPELLAEGLMFADEDTVRMMMAEAKKRGVDLPKAIVNVINRESNFAK